MKPIKMWMRIVAFVGCVLWTGSARSELIRFEIVERHPFADGQTFGDVGEYEVLEGRVHYRLDVNHPANAEVVDLKRANRDATGHVTFTADLCLLAPRDLTKASGAALYDVNNRGNKLALRFFNDSPGGNNPREGGNGFLLRNGFIVVWSGWDGELLPGDHRLQMRAPVASDDGRPITGRVRYEVAPLKKATRMNINRDQHGAYRPTEAGLAGATLTWRLRESDPRVPIPRDQFRVHVTEIGSRESGQLPLIELEVPAGFRPGYLYELIYEAQDPLVHGVCFTAVRDLIAALKHGEGRDNPLLVDGKPVVRRAHGFGVSQSGRFLREMVYSGFNADEQGRIVFDGLMPHVAGGGLGSFNHRFAQPTAFCTQHEHHDCWADRFPFAYETQTDSLSGRTAGLLQRAVASKTAPRVMHTQSSTEYWTRGGSLVHTDTRGEHDAKLPENVRVYAFGGTQHGPASFPPSEGIGQTLANPGDYRPLLRGLLIALDRWAADDVAPPASVYPRIDEGTLVDFSQTSTEFPLIPGVRYPLVIHQPMLLDLGSRWASESIIDVLPPRIVNRYPALVPRYGADGNELGCLLPPEVAVPIASYTGWSLRNKETGPENELVGLNGSYIPLPTTEAERTETADPRPSLEKSYGDADMYRRRIREYCEKLASGGYIVEEDITPIVELHTQRAADAMRKER
ncbi:MAG: hypothetical protein KDA62_11650 [Planctomycetales bacterium]|nr:hypothetical protein [Planctomycetales bacterium]